MARPIFLQREARDLCVLGKGGDEILKFKYFSYCFHFCLFRFVSVDLLFNKCFVSDSAETSFGSSFGSSFGCCESKLVSKDTLVSPIGWAFIQS